MNTLIETVQKNCDISDASHATDYTMCIYLLKMREYFRWQQGYALTDSLPMDKLGHWVTEREAYWDELQTQELSSLPIDNKRFEPYAAEAVNQQLHRHGLVYGGGLGRFCKPDFFLAEILRQEKYAGFEVIVAGTELARDMSATPAMYLDGQITIRRDALKRLVWEKIEEWQWRKQPDNAMGRCLRCYSDGAITEQHLEQITDDEVQAIILHEIGEGQVASELGSGWEQMLHTVAGTRQEIELRAIRDLLADCSSTLPELLAADSLSSLHFFFANFIGMRKALFPSLYAVYQQGLDKTGISRLGELVERGRSHWLQVAQQLLQMRYDSPGERDVLSGYVQAQAL